MKYPTKRQRQSEWTKKTELYAVCKKALSKYKDRYNEHKKGGMIINIKVKSSQGVTKDKQRYFIMIKMSIHWEDITIMKVHAP